MKKNKKIDYFGWLIKTVLLVLVIFLLFIFVKNNYISSDKTDKKEQSFYGYFQDLSGEEITFRDVLKNTDEKIIFGDEVTFELMDAYSKNRSFVARTDLEKNKLYTVFCRSLDGKNIAFNIVEIPSVSITGRVKEVANNMLKVVSNGKMYEVKYDEKTIRQQYDGEKYSEYTGDYIEYPLVVVTSDNNAFYSDLHIMAAHIDTVPFESI